MFEVLDLYCGEGGAAVGYHKALETFCIPHRITGIDIQEIGLYPFDFVRGNAFSVLEKILAERSRSFIKWDFIHTSPMCQKYSLGSQRWNKEREDQLPRVELLMSEIWQKHKIPFVIENVERAPFRMATITLCGIQFGLNVIRHRRFASSQLLFQPYHTIKHPKRGEFVTCAGHGGNGSNKFDVWCKAMDIDWMSKTGLSQAIPWIYTKYIGLQMFANIK